jgi:hypothetical protein
MKHGSITLIQNPKKEHAMEASWLILSKEIQADVISREDDGRNFL